MIRRNNIQRKLIFDDTKWSLVLATDPKPSKRSEIKLSRHYCASIDMDATKLFIIIVLHSFATQISIAANDGYKLSKYLFPRCHFPHFILNIFNWIGFCDPLSHTLLAKIFIYRCFQIDFVDNNNNQWLA